MPAKPLPVLGEFLYLFQRQKLKLGLVFGLSVVLSVLNMSVPYTLKIAVDTIGSGRNMRVLIYVALAILAIYVAKNLLYYGSKSQIVLLAERVAFDLRRRMMTHLHALSVGYYKRQRPAKLSSRLMQDVESIKLFISGELIKLLLNALMFIVGIAIVFSLNPLLACIALAPLPLNALIFWRFSGSIKRRAQEAKEQVSSIGGDLVEQFSGVEAVKSAASEDKEQERFASSMRKGMNALILQSRLYLMQKVGADLVIGVSYFLLFAVTGWLLLKRADAGEDVKAFAGEFVALFGYLGRLYPLSLALMADAGKFSGAAASVDRVYEILHTPPEVRTLSDARPHRIEEGRLEFRNVGFGYGDVELFSNVTFQVGPGEQALITGPSGCGKTALLHLVPRFYDCWEGNIYIDGVNVREFTLSSLREQIGFAFQNCFLFSATVLENIRYVRPGATDAQVIAAAKEALVHEFVAEMPDSYATMIGEGGVGLSFGQRHLIGIARAILRDARIVLMDEPLAALDADCRRRMTTVLHRLSEGRTILMVSSDPGLLGEASKELRFEGGTIHVGEPGGQ